MFYFNSLNLRLPIEQLNKNCNALIRMKGKKLWKGSDSGRLFMECILHTQRVQAPPVQGGGVKVNFKFTINTCN